MLTWHAGEESATRRIPGTREHYGIVLGLAPLPGEGFQRSHIQNSNLLAMALWGGSYEQEQEMARSRGLLIDCHHLFV